MHDAGDAVLLERNLASPKPQVAIEGLECAFLLEVPEKVLQGIGTWRLHADYFQPQRPRARKSRVESRTSVRCLLLFPDPGDAEPGDPAPVLNPLQFNAHCWRTSLRGLIPKFYLRDSEVPRRPELVDPSKRGMPLPRDGAPTPLGFVSANLRVRTYAGTSWFRWLDDEFDVSTEGPQEADQLVQRLPGVGGVQ